jgi:trans-aconitate 2-methyltransferase
VDESEAMLAKAAETSGVAGAPAIEWERADLATWRPARPVDLIYSNAALHWLGDHARLFPSLLGMLTSGGVLAVQMPRMFSAPSHTLVAEAARSGPWRDTLEPLLGPPPVSEPGFYYDLLAHRTATVDIWETEYLHVLEGDDPVKEWFKGSWLAQFLAVLEEPERSEFEASYARLVAVAYPRRPDGRTLLPFRRLFIVASAAGR